MTQTTINAQNISITDDGQICYQPLESNPLPGDAVAKLVKCNALFAPSFEVYENAPISKDDIETGLKAYLDETLSVFVKLNQNDPEKPVSEQVLEICTAMYDAAGMLARADVQDKLSALDNDMRSQLRGKGVRLGPLFIYCPEMNKPAPLRVRAVLWALFNDMQLPAQRVPDGVVSKKVETTDAPITDAQKSLFKALCYPVYGGRVIRIDMLDRVVNAVYEGADKGKFKAQHSMAEWLGCSIADLYAVLESLGHKKLYDPAEEAEKLEQEKAAEANSENITAESPVEADSTEKAEGETEAKENANIKPELATFALKRGQAHKSSAGGKKPFRKSSDDKNRTSGDKKKSFKNKKNKKPRDNGPRVISSGPDKPSLENSPFAVLGQLKK